MSVNNSKKTIKIFRNQKKESSKGLKYIFNAISRKIFSKVYKNEVEYGQTLTSRRRKNCVLKSVSALSCPEGSVRFNSPYDINFQFSRDDTNFRGSVLNFQKIDIEESCCEKCMLKKGDSLSRFSISSDSACDVCSQSSCDDSDCKYRKSSKNKTKSSAMLTKNKSSTLENFIQIHTENFKSKMPNGTFEPNDYNENLTNSLLEWSVEDPGYEPTQGRFAADESDYDILVTKANYRVVEPSYENLKLIESLYEMPYGKNGQESSSGVFETKEVAQSQKTYNEVIESLKLWHLSCQNVEEESYDNDYNNCLEGYESIENELNNDIEEFCC